MATLQDFFKNIETGLSNYGNVKIPAQYASLLNQSQLDEQVGGNEFFKLASALQALNQQQPNYAQASQFLQPTDYISPALKNRLQAEQIKQIMPLSEEFLKQNIPMPLSDIKSFNVGEADKQIDKLTNLSLKATNNAEKAFYNQQIDRLNKYKKTKNFFDAFLPYVDEEDALIYSGMENPQQILKTFVEKGLERKGTETYRKAFVGCTYHCG